MILSIIIPAHNEEKTIVQVLDSVFSVPLGEWEREVVVVNDGSSDGTKDILDKYTSNKIIKIHHAQNLGKGASIQTGLKAATGNYVIIQDADLEYEPGDIPNLLSQLGNLSALKGISPQQERELQTAAAGFPPFSCPPKPWRRRMRGGIKGEVAVFGNRGTKSYPERGFHYVLGAKLLTWTFNILFWQNIKDLYTGYKLIPTAIFKELGITSTGFEFEAEVACKLACRGVNIKEVSINYRPRSKEQGKHIGWKDAFIGFKKILELRIK